MPLFPIPTGMSRAGGHTIIDYLDYWAAVDPDRRYASFLDGRGAETDSYSFLGFQQRSRHLAEYLSREAGLASGDRALLVYSAGLELVVAFFACVRLGAIPVPVCPPTADGRGPGLARLARVAHDCGAKTALTSRNMERSLWPLDGRETRAGEDPSGPSLPRLVTTDDVRGEASADFRDQPGEVLFLQYTSGSTSEPKGVVVSHANVIHNCRAVIDHTPIGVSWLPQYHDMGLIGYYLFPVIAGGTVYGMTPMDFLKRPLLWLQTMSRVRATYASAPNFGFEYCLREDKIHPGSLARLDLSTLRVLMNAAEPARADTCRRFFERFAPCGLRPEAQVVAYGLAENTLAATHHGRRTVTVDKRLLQQGIVRIGGGRSEDDRELRLASCGAPLVGVELRIVDPVSREAVDQGAVGEIWLAGPSTCRGYWNRPEQNRQVFANSLAGKLQSDQSDQSTCRYLATGDLGFLDRGELFVCGRIKDLIIIRGVNYYPQDIESIVASASPRIRSGTVAALAGDGAEETLALVIEVKKPGELPDPGGIVRLIRSQYYVPPRTIVFVPANTISRTTSGKIARALTRRRWLAGELPVIATHRFPDEPNSPATRGQGLKGRLAALLEPFRLPGEESRTLSEIGIDSLAMAALLADIEGWLEGRGAMETARRIDGRLLQRLTMTELFGLADRLDDAQQGAAAPLIELLERLQTAQDDEERSRMRRDARLESSGQAGAVTGAIESVLLTGPTGFFGPFLLESLLRCTPHRYVALVRADDPESGRKRVVDALAAARLLTPALEAEVERRVQVVCGDISRHDLGLPQENWRSLAVSVQAVVHNAARVNYVQSYDALRPHNVDGTRELLRFASTGVRKSFHLISSTIIFGWNRTGALHEWDDNAQMQELDFGYAQSKWVAEQLVFAARRCGLPVRIYRPSFISASTGGVASGDDIVIRLLAFMINHGVAVNSLNQLSFLPADTVADSIAAIVHRGDPDGPTLHLTADGYYNMMDVTALITKEYGFPFVYYDIPEFVARMNLLSTRDTPVYPLLDFFNRSHPKIAVMQHKRYNNDRYREERARLVPGSGEPALRETVSYIMSHLFRERLIPPALIKI